MSREMNSNAIKLNDVKAYVKSNVMLQVAQLAAPRLAIQGAPGCGKSDLMRQMCEENGWILSVKYLSNMSLEQITGLPCKVENGSTAIWTKPELFNFNNPEYAPKGANDDTIKILLIDDFHLADRIMQKYLFQLLTYKSLNVYSLQKNNAIILAGNRNIDKAGANPIPAPVCNRMMFVEVKSDAEDWLKNFAMKHGVREDICTYIMNNSEGRLSSEPIETAAWASPRSWTYLSYQMDAYEKAFGKIGLDDLKIMATGLIGPENTAKFIEYHELFAKWDYNKLFGMSLKSAEAEYAKEIKKNPTDAYAIIASGVSWVIEKYKKTNYNAADKDIVKSVDFLYDTMTFLLTYKDQSARRNIRPLIAAGCKFLYMWQMAAEQNNGTNTKKATTSLLSLIFNKMKQERDVDWLFYELIANVIDFKLDADDLKKIEKAKKNLAF
jgi:hypothetical protein